MGLTSGPPAFIVVGWSQILKTILNRNAYTSVLKYMHTGYICDWHYVSDLLCAQAFSAILYIYFTWDCSALKLQVPCMGKHCNPRQTRIVSHPIVHSSMLVCLCSLFCLFLSSILLHPCSWWLTSAFIYLFFSFWQLWVKLLCTLLHKCFCGHIYFYFPWKKT